MSCKWRRVCPLRRLEAEGVIDLRWKKEYCLSESNWKNCKRFQAEEKGLPHSDLLLCDGSYLEKDE
jgi:hypothetical protein